MGAPGVGQGGAPCRAAICRLRGARWLSRKGQRAGGRVPLSARFAEPPGAVAAGAVGCAVPEGLRGFRLEFTLL